MPAIRADSKAGIAVVARARRDALVEAELAKQRQNWLSRMLESADALGAEVQARKELEYLTDELNDIARMLQDVAAPLVERFESVRASTDPEAAAAGMRELRAGLKQSAEATHRTNREDHGMTGPLHETPAWELERQASKREREKAEAEEAGIEARRGLRGRTHSMLRNATYFIEADAEKDLGRPSKDIGEFLGCWARQMARLHESPREADLPGVLKKIAAAADGPVEKAAIDLLTRGAAGHADSIETVLKRLHKDDIPFFHDVAEYLRAGGKRPGELIDRILDTAFSDLAAASEAGETTASDNPATVPVDDALNVAVPKHQHGDLLAPRGPQPHWIASHFRSQQFRLLQSLWGPMVPEPDLVKELGQDQGKDPAEAVRKLVSRTNASLIAAMDDIGELWQIHERTRGDVKYRYLEKDVSGQK